MIIILLSDNNFFVLNLVERSSPLWIFKLKTSGLFLEHFGLDFIDYIRVVQNGAFWKT